MHNTARNPGKRRRTIRLFTNLSLILGGILLPLVLAEVGMRLHHTYRKIRSGYMPAANPRLIFTRKPHSDQEINGLGFRDHEYTVQKPADVFRIVVLGDSVTNGYRVDFDEMYTKKLEALLNEHDGRYEVVNLGMNQYSTVQEVALLKEIGLSLSPDLVLLAYVLNDPTPEGSINDFFQQDQAPSLVWDWIVRKSKPLLRIREPFTRLRGCHSFDYYSHMHCDATRWTAVRGAFRELRAVSRQYDFPVLVVIFPLLPDGQDASFDGYQWRSIHERVAEEAILNGFSSLDLLPHFAKRRPIELKAAEADHLHPNGLGHQIAATTIYRALVYMGLAHSSSD